MEILAVINEYTGLITLGIGTFGGIAMLWLSKNFYTKNEAEKDRIEIHQRLADLEKSKSEHEILLKNMPTKDDLCQFKVSMERLEGEINTQNEKFVAVNENIDRLLGSINMLTEYHIKG